MVCKKHEWIKNPNPKGLEDVWICKNCGRDRLFSAGFAKPPKDLDQTLSFDTKLNAMQVIQRIGEDLYKSVGSAVRELYVNALSHGCLPCLQLLEQQEGFDYDKCTELPKVEVTLDPQVRKLIIHDINGTGMSKYVIESALTSIGDSDNVDRSRGGMFGMGVFAFMKLTNILHLDTWSRETNERFSMICRDGMKWDVELDENDNPVIPDMYSEQNPDLKGKSTYGTKLTMVLKETVNMNDIVDTINAVGKYWSVETTLWVVNELNAKIDVAESDSKSYLSKIKARDIRYVREWEMDDDDDDEEERWNTRKPIVKQGFTTIGRSHLRSDLIKSFEYGDKWSKDAMDESCAWVTFDNDDYEFHGAIFKTLDTTRHIKPQGKALLVNVPIALNDEAIRYIPKGITGWIINIKDEGKYRPVGSRDQLNDESCIKLAERLKKDFKAFYKEIGEIVNEVRSGGELFSDYETEPTVMQVEGKKDTVDIHCNWMLNAVKALHAKQKNLHKFIEIGDTECGNVEDDYNHRTTEDVYFHRDNLEHISKALHMPIKARITKGKSEYTCDTIISNVLCDTDNIFKQGNNNEDQRKKITTHLGHTKGGEFDYVNKVVHSIATGGCSIFIVKRFKMAEADEWGDWWEDFGLVSATEYVKEHKLNKKMQKTSPTIPQEIVCWRVGYGANRFESDRMNTEQQASNGNLVRLKTTTSRMSQISRNNGILQGQYGSRWSFTKTSKKLDDYLVGTLSEEEWLTKIGKRKIWIGNLTKGGAYTLVQTDVASFKDEYRKLTGKNIKSVSIPEDHWNDMPEQKVHAIYWDDQKWWKLIRQTVTQVRGDDYSLDTRYDESRKTNHKVEQLWRRIEYNRKDVAPGTYDTPQFMVDRMIDRSERQIRDDDYLPTVFGSTSELSDLYWYWNMKVDYGYLDINFESFTPNAKMFELFDEDKGYYDENLKYNLDILLKTNPDAALIRAMIMRYNPAKANQEMEDDLVKSVFDGVFEIIEKFENYRDNNDQFDQLVSINHFLENNDRSLYCTDGWRNLDIENSWFSTLLGMSLDKRSNQFEQNYYEKFIKMIKPLTVLSNMDSYTTDIDDSKLDEDEQAEAEKKAPIWSKKYVEELKVRGDKVFDEMSEYILYHNFNHKLKPSSFNDTIWQDIARIQVTTWGTPNEQVKHWNETVTFMKELELFVQSLMITDVQTAEKWLNGIWKGKKGMTLKVADVRVVSGGSITMDFEYTTEKKTLWGDKTELFDQKKGCTYEIESVEPNDSQLLFTGEYRINTY